MKTSTIVKKIHSFASAINVMCTKGSPILEVVCDMRKYADDLAADRMGEPKEQRLNQSFSVFNCHVNNAKARADSEFIKQFGPAPFAAEIAPLHESGIMAIFNTEPTKYTMAWVVLCTAYVNENRV